jgi:hypothetical protein
VEPAGSLAGDAAGEYDGDLVGPAERELIGKRLLKPGAAGGGAVEHTGIGDLKLPERQVIAIAAPAILGGER